MHILEPESQKSERKKETKTIQTKFLDKPYSLQASDHSVLLPHAKYCILTIKIFDSSKSRN